MGAPCVRGAPSSRGRGSKGPEEDLAIWLENASRVVVVGLGNPLRSDDSVGLAVVHPLIGQLPGAVLLVEIEGAPDLHLRGIVEHRPSHVLLVDAAATGRSGGAVHLRDSRELMGEGAVSSHCLPLGLFCDQVGRMSGAKVALLLIEPVRTGFGEGLSPEVEAAAAKVRSLLARVLGGLPGAGSPEVGPLRP